MDREVLFVIGYSDNSLFVGHDLDFLICFETEHSLAVHFSEFLQSERKLVIMRALQVAEDQPIASERQSENRIQTLVQ